MQRIEHKAAELDFGNRSHSCQRQAHGYANNSRFGNRRVEDPFAAKLLEQPLGYTEHATLPGHVLAEDDDTVIFGHLLAQGQVQCLHHVPHRHRLPPARTGKRVGEFRRLPPLR
ncbi:hypothetical protein HRbin36_02293 [bacterium HR36]|nr:hypothetical protein HRbin36_02293 [bacterium HR36]